MTATQPEGFLALPAGGAGAPVLVLHAWWGLNDTIKTLCNRLAAAGYVAFAPDLYHGQVADTIEGAQALGKALDANFAQARAEVGEAARYVVERAGSSGSGLAVIGFSLGAYYAIDLSTTEPDLVRSVVVFYGAGEGDFSAARAAYLCHFAEDDPYEPREYQDAMEEALRQAGRPVTFHRYPGTGHWFFEPDRADAYNREAADLAWERTLAFLDETLRS